MTPFTESIVEEAALDWIASLGYAILHGPEIALGQPAAERSDPAYCDVILERRLRGAQARVIDFDLPNHHDWLAVNQFTVAEGLRTRRPDVVLFVNGLPLAVIELKNPADENATIKAAFQQLQIYQAQVPALFTTNAALVISDGVSARIGALGAGWEWFKPWRTITGQGDAPPSMPELEVILRGVFEPRRFLDLLRYFIAFEDTGAGAGGGANGGIEKVIKKMAGYHQFHAVPGRPCR